MPRSSKKTTAPTRTTRPLLLSRTEIQERYGIPVRTMERHSEQGTGPAEIRDVTRSVLYAETDVVAWLQARGMSVDAAAVAAHGLEPIRSLRDEISQLRELVAELTARLAL